MLNAQLTLWWLRRGASVDAAARAKENDGGNGNNVWGQRLLMSTHEPWERDDILLKGTDARGTVVPQICMHGKRALSMHCERRQAALWYRATTTRYLSCLG